MALTWAGPVSRSAFFLMDSDLESRTQKTGTSIDTESLMVAINHP